MIFRNNNINNSGQALVELAIILPLLLILVFGVTEFGLYLFYKNSATNAAREGARRASVSYPWNATDVENYTKSQPQMSDASVSFSYSASPLTTGAAVTVTVRKHFSSVVPNFLPLFKNLTSISAKATMRYE